MTEKQKRPNYTKEFKQDAMKLVLEQRYSCPEIGRRKATNKNFNYRHTHFESDKGQRHLFEVSG